MISSAVVLAAGSGTRLHPLADRTPKCLLDIGGSPILGRLLDALAAAGVRRAVVVTGHMSDQVDEFVRAAPLDVVTVRNDDYATTNNAASLALARPVLGDVDFVLCDGDVVFTANPLLSLVAAADASALLVDADAPLDDEAMKVSVDGGRIVRISKAIGVRDALGESIGLQKIGGEATRQLWAELDSLVARDASRAYYEDAFQGLIDNGVRFGACRISGGTWAEIDDFADLERARLLIDRK